MQETNLKPIRVALYSRVSSEEQREGQTIDSQVSEIDRFAHDKGWIVSGVYKDEGWSGALLARPGLDQLRDDARRGAFEAVLINDVDRLARDVSHLGIVRRDLERNAVRVVFKKLPSENSPTHNLMVNILGSFAEFERELILDRTRRGRRHKVEVRQEFLGGLCPYGYRYYPKDKTTNKAGVLEVVPEEAIVVRQMFGWVDKEGLSAHKVTERLTVLKISPRKKGESWGKSSVLRILRNETYAGVWHYNKHESCEPLKPSSKEKYRRVKASTRLRPTSDWIAVKLSDNLRIIEPVQWRRVQDQLQRNRCFSIRNSIHSYLLKGLVRCAGCGSRFVGDPCHGKFYYRCLKRCKKVRTITESILDGVVWSAIEKAVLNPALIAKQFEDSAARQSSVAHSLERESDELDRALTEIRQEESRIIEAYRKNIISPEHLSREIAQFGTRRTAIEERKAALAKRTQSRPQPEIRKSIDQWCKAVADALIHFSPLERQRFLQLLVDEVWFDGTSVRIKCVLPPTGQLMMNSETATATVEALVDDATSRSDKLALPNDSGFELKASLPVKPLSIVDRVGADYLRTLVAKYPAATLLNYCRLVQKERLVAISEPTMCKLLLRVGLPLRVRRQLADANVAHQAA
jgi:site-specific DNA recombinase